MDMKALPFPFSIMKFVELVYKIFDHSIFSENVSAYYKIITYLCGDESIEHFYMFNLTPSDSFRGNTSFHFMGLNV